MIKKEKKKEKKKKEKYAPIMCYYERFGCFRKVFLEKKKPSEFQLANGTLGRYTERDRGYKREREREK